MQVEPVIHLMHLAEFSTLATQSQQLPGYPYATAVPNVLDENHRPLLLVSRLAEHTKNLLADPRVSLSLVEPGTTNIQTAARITLLGDAEQFQPDDLLKTRYLRYLPDAAQYLELDFMFFRINPQRIRFIAGIGKMGWLEVAALGTLPSVSLQKESALVKTAQQAAPTGIRILGVDCFGIDYEADGFRDRQKFIDHDELEGIDEGILRSVASQLS